MILALTSQERANNPNIDSKIKRMSKNALFCAGLGATLQTISQIKQYNDIKPLSSSLKDSFKKQSVKNILNSAGTSALLTIGLTAALELFYSIKNKKQKNI